MTTTDELTRYTTPELQAELARRATIRQLEAKQRRMTHEATVVKHIDVLLLLKLEHSANSCSDDHPKNDGRCSRCSLLAIKKYGYVPERWNINVDVTYRLDMPEHYGCER